MSDPELHFLQTVAELREVFDKAFTVPARPSARDSEAFLAIRVAGRPFVLRVADIGRLELSRKIVSLPGRTPNLLGLAGIQGRLVPVYSLAVILELGPATGEGRWIAVCGREEELLGVAFEEFERFLQIPRIDLVLIDTGEPMGQPMQQAVREANAVRPVLSFSFILARVRERMGMSGDVSKEV